MIIIQHVQSTLSTRKKMKKGVRRKIEKRMKILALVFFFLSLTLPYVVLADLKWWVLELFGNDLSFRIQFVSSNFPSSIVVQIPCLV